MSAILVIVATVIAQVIVVGFVAKTWKPDFYGRKLAISQDALAVHGAALEKKLQQLREDTSDENGIWSVALSDEQINGWLAVELPRRFPRSLPNDLHEPRVAIDSELFHVACQYSEGATKVVLTMCVDLEPTDKPNELRFKVVSAKIGSVPGLEHQAVGQIAQAAYRSKIGLRWINRDEQPEAILRIPNRWLDENRQVHIEQIEFQEGQLLVSGKSSERPVPAGKQRTVAQRRVRRE